VFIGAIMFGSAPQILAIHMRKAESVAGRPLFGVPVVVAVSGPTAVRLIEMLP